MHYDTTTPRVPKPLSRPTTQFALCGMQNSAFEPCLMTNHGILVSFVAGDAGKSGHRRTGGLRFRENPKP
jgi:hypothetical protein